MPIWRLVISSLSLPSPLGSSIHSAAFLSPMKSWNLLPLHSVSLFVLLLRAPSSSAGALEPSLGGGPLHFRPLTGGGGGVADPPQQRQGALDAAASLTAPAAGQPAQEQRRWSTQGGSSEEMMEGPHEGLRDLRVDLDGTRADHGIQEPLSFYGNVSERDPPSIPKVPVWMWVASTAICSLLLLLWLFHQRRVSAAAASLRRLQGRCFSPPAAVHMAFVFAFFPLSGVVAWLSLVEPRGGLLLSQLRSAWEVCCLHCFMLLMLHLLGGPDRALLLVQQQHRLPSAETIDRMLLEAGDAKSSDQESEGSRGAAATNGEEPRHLSAQSSSSSSGNSSSTSSSSSGAPQVQMRGAASIKESADSSAAPNNSNSCSNNSSSSRLATVRLLAPRRWRRGMSAPDLLLSAAAEGTAAPAAAAGAAAGRTAAAPAAASGSTSVGVSGAPGGLGSPPRLSLQAVAEGPSEHELAAAEEGASSCKSLLRSYPEGASPSAASRLKIGLRKRLARRGGSKRLSQRCARLAEVCACKSRKQPHEHPSSSPAAVTSSLISSSISSTTSSTSSTLKQRSIWLRCRDSAHKHRLKIVRSHQGVFRGFHRGPFAAAATPPLPAAAATDAADAMPDQEPFNAALAGNLPVASTPPDAAAAASPPPAASAAVEAPRSLSSERQQQQQQQHSCCSSSGPQGKSSAVGADVTPEGCSSSAAAAGASSSSSKTDQSHQQQQQQHQYVVRMSSTDGGGGPALTCSTCSSPRTPDGPCRCFCVGDSKKAAHADWGFVLEAVEDGKKQEVQQQLLLHGPAAAAAAPAAAAEGMASKETDAAGFRRIWFVPPLCCLAWKSKPRAFSAWDLRMSYRCLLPFTILKLLRLLLCYLLPPLISLGDSCRGNDSAAASAADTAAAPAVAAAAAASVDHQGHQQHLLQRLLQLCCFLSLVLAMWGLAVVFVATRKLLKPFRIGWKFTCLKMLVFFIQVLELAAELFKPKVSADADAATAAAGAAGESGLDPAAAAAAAATTAAAHKVYIFTFLELLGSALCALMALWAFRADELLLAHRRLLLLQQYLLPASAESSSESEGESKQKQSPKRGRFAAFARRSFRPLFMKG
ncbi:hypothetical protein Emed_004179 [Eimeria media]